MSATPDLQTLRRAFAERRDGARQGPQCPPPDRLWSACHGDLPPPEAADLVAHIAGCAACAEDWRLARELGGGATAGVRTMAAVPARTRWVRWATFAAAAAAGLAWVAVLNTPRPGPPAAFRQGEAPLLRSLVPEDRPLSRGDCVLRWTGGPAGARYALRVVTERLDPVERADGLQRTEHRVPAETLRSLPPGTRLLWQVEARTADGLRQSSPTFVSRLE